jgi:glucose/arabinose dehydrogenase
LADWNSLGDGFVNSGTHAPAEFPIGTGAGDSWEEMFNLSSSIVAEAFFEGSSMLESGLYVSLGNLYDGPAEDIAFRYRLANGEFVDGEVEYLGLPGDYNDDSVVNAADYTVWRDNLNGTAELPNDQTPGAVTAEDYDLWVNAFGSAAVSGSGSLVAVPEPRSIMLCSMIGFAVGMVSMRRGKRISIAAAMLLPMFAAGSARGQSLTTDPLAQANFSHISQIGTSLGAVTQMTLGPDGKLYVATYGSGIKRFDYDPSGNLSNGITVWSTTRTGNYVNGSLGLAFHEDPTLGTVMYLSPAVTFGVNPQINVTQSIVRLTDNDGDGNWGEAGEVNQAIVNNLRITDLHQVNQMQVRDDTLYVGIGSRTRTGGDASEYGGAPNPDDGEFAYTGAINWIRDLTQLSGDTTTANLAGHNIVAHHTDTQAFTSTDTGKLTIYSTGFRNVYGLAFDGEGQLWATMNQNENPLKPDELHRSDFQDDHGFPKINEVSGNWKTNATAIAAGYFQTFETPVALLGNNASADGITFTDHTPALEDYPFIVRWGNGDDLLMVNPDTGFVHQVAAGFNNPLSLLPDPNGHLLLGTHGSGGRIYRLWMVNPDLDEDEEVDFQDWLRVRNNFNITHAEMTVPEARALGDLNGDFKTDLVDYGLFKNAYEGIHGEGSFAALLAVPEPHSLALIVLACVGLISRSRLPSGAFRVVAAFCP